MARTARSKRAARLAKESPCSFVLDADSERAEEVLLAATTTTVPVDVFDQISRALGEPPAPNPALQRTAQRRRRVFQA